MIQTFKNAHALSSSEVLQQIQSSEHGLEPREVVERLKIYGKNEIPDPGKIAIWKIILKQFNNLMVYILMVAMGISFFTRHYVDVYVILAIILINALIGFVQEYRAEGA